MILQNRQSMVARLHALCDCRARYALEVAPDADQREVGRALDELLDLDVLAETEFKDEIAAGAQLPGRFRHEARDDFEAVAAAEQGERRFEVADLRLEGRPGTVNDVGRIRDDRVERLLDGVEPPEQVAGPEADAAADAVTIPI